MRRIARTVAGCALAACSAGHATSPADDASAPDRAAPVATDCPAIAIAADGSCAGAPTCGAGFAADPAGARSCVPVLPPDDAPCADGEVAWLGDTSCHDVVDCADGTWGAIPIDADTVFVAAPPNTGATGDGPNGTAARPWTTIADGVAHAAAGAVVAIAAGRYAENVVVRGAGVRLWGRCPRLVEIAPAKGDAVTLAADGAELHAVGVTGGQGVVVTGAADVVVDGVRAHDTAIDGIRVTGASGPVTRLTVRNAAVERAGRRAVTFETGDALVERVSLRNAGGGVPDDLGNGVVLALVAAPPPVAPRVTLRSAVVDGSGGHVTTTIDVRGAALVLEDAYVRNATDTNLAASNATVVARDLVVEQTEPHEDPLSPPVAIDLEETDADLDGVVVRAHGNLGIGASSIGDRSFVLTRATVEGWLGWAVDVTGNVHATVDALLLRDGRGDADWSAVGIRLELAANVGPAVALTRSVLAGCSQVGVEVLGGGVQAASTRIVGVAPATLSDGTGQSTDDAADAVSLRADAEHPASARLVGCAIERAARAGISAFGPAVVSLATTAFVDDAIDIDVEDDRGDGLPTVTDGSGNTCVSGGVPRTCAALSSGLSPPRAR